LSRIKSIDDASKMDSYDYQRLKEDMPEIRNIFTSDKIRILTIIYAGLIKEYSNELEEAELFFHSLLLQYERQTPGAEKLTPSMIIGPNLGPIILIKKRLADILVKKSKYQEGLSYAYELEPYFRKDKSLRPKLAAILKVQADALLKLGKLNEAIDKLNEGIEDLDQYNDLNLLWQLQWQKGLAFSILGKRGDALNAYSQAIKTANNLRKIPMSYRLESTYLRDKLELFEAAIKLSSEDNYDARLCCDIIESVKSRLLTAALSIPNNQASSAGSELKRKFLNLSKQLHDLEFIAAQLRRAGSNTEEKEREMKSIMAEREDLLERIHITEPRWKLLSEPISFDLGRIIHIFNDRKQSAINLFYRSDNVIVAVLIKNSEVSTSTVTITKDTETKLEEYQRQLQGAPTKKDGKAEWRDLSKWSSITAEHIIPSELLSQALESRGLVIIPHGILHIVPWAGLTFKDKRLFEYCPISILPNLSCIPNLNANFVARPPLGIIGYADDQTLQDSLQIEFEVEDIEKMYSDRSRIIEGSAGKATRKNFWGLMNSQNAEGGILHVACHGIFDSIQPMNSGLILADSKKVDAAEIAMSSVGYDEVILSACSSGMRPIQVQTVKLIADDIIGLPGAFLEAGAKSVLVSIPPNHGDAAYTFMKLYHENRLSGKTPLFALQETQKTMLNDSGYSSQYQPYEWVGFTIYGYQ
jgi:CHAT domain-containing protein